MTFKRFAYAAVGAAMLTGPLVIISATPASAVCHAPITGDWVTGTVRVFTEGKARSNWASKVRGIWGGSFAHWVNRARNKTMNCRKTAPGQTWHCQARARPCNA
jgi:hypothetical protein